MNTQTRRQGDHPRVCGEKIPSWQNKYPHQGSPPRVRGKDDKDNAEMKNTGITPACAGKSHGITKLSTNDKDHPRVCGEKNFDVAQQQVVQGSPPRVRGKAAVQSDEDGAGGITPACAGKRTTPPQRACAIWDHPRVCGEKDSSAPPRAEIPGSPPRVRGKVALAIIPLRGNGITPACAGKRRHLSPNQRYQRDHPRVCGEKNKPTDWTFEQWGSPPRVRGKAQGYFWGFRLCGITPACAGKSSRPLNAPCLAWDHPRVCGEKSRFPGFHQRCQGSPPRVRGKGWAGSPRGSISGITPACAGKSKHEKLKGDLD